MEQATTQFKVISVSEWLNSGSESSTNTVFPLPLVDLRRESEYLKRRLCYKRIQERYPSASPSSVRVVNLPLDTLVSGERSCELPPRHVPFVVLVPIKYTNEFMHKNKHGRIERPTSTSVNKDPNENYSDEGFISNFFLASKSKATQQSRVAWKVENILLDCDCDSSKSCCSEQCIWTESSKLKIISPPEEPLSLPPLPRLWEPDPLVQKDLFPLLTKSLDDHIKSNSSKGSKLQIWDLGCGAGRDICYLAQSFQEWINGMRGGNPSIEMNVRFVGVDNHKGSAARCLPLWRHCLVSNITDTRMINLNNVEHFSSALSDQQVVMCYSIRFLNRKLLAYITSKSCALSKGTIYATSHFCKASDGASWLFDHPSARHVLERSELRNLFESSSLWTVLKDEIVQDSDHGRTMIHFVAQKK